MWNEQIADDFILFWNSMHRHTHTDSSDTDSIRGIDSGPSCLYHNHNNLSLISMKFINYTNWLRAQLARLAPSPMPCSIASHDLNQCMEWVGISWNKMIRWKWFEEMPFILYMFISVADLVQLFMVRISRFGSVLIFRIEMEKIGECFFPVRSAFAHKFVIRMADRHWSS